MQLMLDLCFITTVLTMVSLVTKARAITAAITSRIMMTSTATVYWEGGKEGGRKGEHEGGRENRSERERERGRKGWRETEREGEWERREKDLSKIEIVMCSNPTSDSSFFNYTESDHSCIYILTTTSANLHIPHAPQTPMPATTRVMPPATRRTAAADIVLLPVMTS